eukprot:gene11132-3192_t
MAVVLETTRAVAQACRTVICVGRNYRCELKETDQLRFDSMEGPSIPSVVTECHHEVELGVVIKLIGKRVTEDKAMDFVSGYLLALDITARNLQQNAKEKGLPWTVAKGYDTFCPISEFIPKERVVDSADLRLWCKVDGELRQDGNTRDMIFSIPSLIQYISNIFTLQPGDIILTGTPSGVGPIRPGQTISCGLDTRPPVSMTFPCVQGQ